MEQRIESLKRLYEAKVLEADENIKLLLKNPMALADHSDINKEIDKWLGKKIVIILNYNIY